MFHGTLRLKNFSGRVTIIASDGSLKVHGFSSRLTLNDVSGPVKAHTFSGAVAIREKAWGSRQLINVDTFSGSVKIDR